MTQGVINFINIINGKDDVKEEKDLLRKEIQI